MCRAAAEASPPIHAALVAAALRLRRHSLCLFSTPGFSEASVQEQAELAQDIAAANDGAGFEFATVPEDRTRLWEARHNAW